MRVLKPIIGNLLRHPLHVSVIDDQREWKGITLYIAALHVARQIERTSDRPNVAFMLPTSGLSPVALIAIWMLGRTAVPLNYLLKGEDLEYVIEHSEIDTVITVGPMLEHFGPLPEHIRQIRLDEMSFKGFPPLRRSKKQPDDFVAAIMYTSGTSGRPKGVMLTSGNLASNVQQAVQWAGFNERSSFLGVLPQFHSFGLTVLTVLPLSIGSRVIYTARFSPRKLLDLMEKHRPNVFLAIPSMYNALLNAKSAKADHFSSMRFIVSGSEALPKAVADGFRERFGVVINEGYGLTETSPITNLCLPEQHRDKSVGPAITGVTEKIVDADGKTLGPNQDGEVLIKGPNIMKGYFKQPEETTKVIDADGFLHTGDMGRFDDDGHLYITGRFKELLIIGGENVAPREIEEVLNAHPAVSASAVIGMQDPSRGEVPLAFIELADAAKFNETALRSHCREHLAQYKVPRDIRVVEALPRNPTGKILRRELNAEIESIA